MRVPYRILDRSAYSEQRQESMIISSIHSGKDKGSTCSMDGMSTDLTTNPFQGFVVDGAEDYVCSGKYYDL